jgi:hypothetical protein
MTSIVQICNIALSNIGEQRISALTDNTERARLCNLRFEDCRDAVLRSYPWKCAVARSALASTTTAPAWGFAFQYVLPSDCLRVLDIEEFNQPYEIEGKFIVTDATSVKLKYIQRVEDPNQFDSLLIQAVALKLASELAESVSGRADLRDRMLSKYLQVISEARGVDATERSMPEELTADLFINSRIVGSEFRRAKFSSEI